MFLRFVIDFRQLNESTSHTGHSKSKGKDKVHTFIWRHKQLILLPRSPVRTSGKQRVVVCAIRPAVVQLHALAYLASSPKHRLHNVSRISAIVEILFFAFRATCRAHDLYLNLQNSGSFLMTLGLVNRRFSCWIITEFHQLVIITTAGPSY